MTRVGQFSASVVNVSTKFLERDSLRKSVRIQNHSASKDVAIKVGSAFLGAVTQTQTISFSATPTAGAWKVTYGGNESGSLAYNINAADLQTALRLISGLSSVTVSGSVAAGFVVTMTSVSHVSGNPALMSVTSNTLIKAAVHTISFSDVPTAGGWKIKIGAFTTANLAYNLNAAGVQTAVRLLTGLSTATVTGNYTDGFVLSLPGTAFAASVDVVESTLNIAEVFEAQLIEFSAVPDAGTWTIAYGAEITTALAFGANAAAVQAAVRLLEGLEAATVTGNYTSGFTVTFVNVESDVDDLVVADSLTASAAPVTTTVTETVAYVAPETVSATVANTTPFESVTGSVAISAKGNLADVGVVIAEGASYEFKGANCENEFYAKAEDTTAVSFEVIAE